ncbi:hypothetical protein PIB30_090498, partial [Stylosanthes scabra]|nr:hypothetical protein [Stylosanthes scabra]
TWAILTTRGTNLQIYRHPTGSSSHFSESLGALWAKALLRKLANPVSQLYEFGALFWTSPEPRTWQPNTLKVQTLLQHCTLGQKWTLPSQWPPSTPPAKLCPDAGEGTQEPSSPLPRATSPVAPSRKDSRNKVAKKPSSSDTLNLFQSHKHSNIPVTH